MQTRSSFSLLTHQVICTVIDASHPLLVINNEIDLPEFHAPCSQAHEGLVDTQDAQVMSHKVGHVYSNVFREYVARNDWTIVHGVNAFVPLEK
jgi:hypothetical protein